MSCSPEIRFEGFDDPWRLVAVISCFEGHSGGGTPSTSNPSYWTDEIPWFQTSDIFEDSIAAPKPKKSISVRGLDSSAARLIPSNSLAVVTRVAVGKVAYVGNSYSTSQDFLNLIGAKGDGKFLARRVKLLMERVSHQLQGTSIKGLASSDVLNGKIMIPENFEQISISSLFDLLENLITLQEQKIAQLEDVKRTMLAKMFPKKGEDRPEIRFEGFDEPWAEKKLGSFALKVTEKNRDNKHVTTYTNSAEYGIIPQREFFEKDISNSKNLSTYYIVRQNDFIYNPRISSSAPAGPINRNKISGEGVMSPLYTVFRIDPSVSPVFLEYLFAGSSWHEFMLRKGNSGARSDRLAIGSEDFFRMPLMIPSSEEQELIAMLFDLLYRKISEENQRLVDLRKMKTSLMNKMFV